MTNRSKQKGTSFESSVLPAIKEKRPLAERRALGGANDKGDFYIPEEHRFIIEAKNHREMDLSGWLKEATIEAENAGVPYGVVFHKKRGVTDPREQYATMKVGTFLDLAYPKEKPMGWGSAYGHFNDVADKLIEIEADDDTKRIVLSALIKSLRDGDWDTAYDSLQNYLDDPAIVEAFRENGIVWDDDEDGPSEAEDDGWD